MTIEMYNTQEELGDAFEERMEALEDIARLQEEIIEQEIRADRIYDEWIDAKEGLAYLQGQLEELEMNNG